MGGVEKIETIEKSFYFIYLFFSKRETTEAF